MVRRLFLRGAVALLLAGSAAGAFGGGPRFVTGSAFSATGPGAFITFYTPQVTYATDPGALSASVTHAQADAMVAAAAAVWNVPYASLTLAQAGTLAEHVSSANAYFDGTRMVFPADVSASNYLSIPIAVIYDSDGSVTDQLLGAGASSPAGCRQNGVTNVVDGFSANGRIQHALVILNGRCAGSSPQQMAQMEYQTMRAFGRVLGLAWSQLNDNVFTGATPPTASDMANWPVMHPIDIVCGPYTYQCMQNPFALRLDDVAALSMLYPVVTTNSASGKIATLDNAASLHGQVFFPAGSGMEMVNVTVKRLFAGTSYVEASEVVSTVSGMAFQANGGNRVSGAESSALNAGRLYPETQGEFWSGRIPTGYLASLFLTTEPINPLYTGTNALGIFQRPVATMSGSPVTAVGESLHPGYQYLFYFMEADAAPTCSPGTDGVESAPVAADPTGLWTGQLCGMGHLSWFTVAAKAGHTLTVETTALDDAGNATLQKAQPVLGVWNSSDALYTAPTVASAPYAMNALAPGVTQVRVGASSLAASYRVVVADQFGAGRPDFVYRARVLYADTLAQSSVGMGGGLLTITGMGFLPGNVVLVHGVRGTVLSVSPTQITAIAPSLAASGAASGTPVDVEVFDPHTGGSSTMAAALTYTMAPDLVQTVSAPTALDTGYVAATSFVVRVLTSDGLAPAIGATVSFTVTQGRATLGCGAATCVVTTDGNGNASTTVLGLAAGTVTVTATEVSGGGSVAMTAVDTDPVLTLALTQPAQPLVYLAAGANAQWTLTVAAGFNGLPAPSVPVAWSVSSGAGLSPAAMATDSAGAASATLTLRAAAAGVVTVRACAWTTVCSSWSVTVVDAAQWTPGILSGAGQRVRQGTALAPVVLQIQDAAGHPLPGATATIHQEVLAWEAPCPAVGRCPAAPVLATSVVSVTADASGSVSITPLTVPSQPQVTAIAVVTGTQGFVSLTLVTTP